MTRWRPCLAFECNRMSNDNFFWSEIAMSLGKQKNLIVLGAVLAALLVGGVLVADYADVLPGRAKADEPVKACQSGEAKLSCAAKAEAAGFPQVVAATTQAAPEKACCGGEKPAGACCNPGGDCDSCEKPAGGCGDAVAGCGKPKPAEVAGGCCAAKADAATK